MSIRYRDIVKAVRHSRKIILIVGTVIGAIVCTLVSVELADSRYGVPLALAAFITVFIGLLINFLAVGKRLKRMWANVGSPDTDEIEKMLGSAVCLESGNIMLLLTDETVLNFETIRAYRLTDITELYKTASTDEGSVISYDIAVKCGGYPFKGDTLTFVKAEERDAAFDMILQAYRTAGGMEKITEH